MKTFILEMRVGQPTLSIEADKMYVNDVWTLFMKNAPTGGEVEYCRYKTSDIIGITQV